MRILIAEDDADLNKIIVKKLRAEGHAVDGCTNGREALDYLTAGDYDAAILDIMMPEMDGLAALRELRRQGNVTPVTVLMLSVISGFTLGTPRISGSAGK